MCRNNSKNNNNKKVISTLIFCSLCWWICKTYLSNFFGETGHEKKWFKIPQLLSHDKKPSNFDPKTCLMSLLNVIYLEEAKHLTKHNISQAESPKRTQETVVTVVPIPRIAGIIRPGITTTSQRSRFHKCSPLRLSCIDCRGPADIL